MTRTGVSADQSFEERSRSRHNVITRLVSVHRWMEERGNGGAGKERERKRDYTWRGERQLILTFLSENQSVVIPEAACVISSLCQPTPSPSPVSLFSSKSHGPSATPVSTFPQTLFPVPYRAFVPNTLDPRPPRAPSLSLCAIHEPLIYY